MRSWIRGSRRPAAPPGDVLAHPPHTLHPLLLLHLAVNAPSAPSTTNTVWIKLRQVFDKYSVVISLKTRGGSYISCFLINFNKLGIFELNDLYIESVYIDICKLLHTRLMNEFKNTDIRMSREIQDNIRRIT